MARKNKNTAEQVEQRLTTQVSLPENEQAAANPNDKIVRGLGIMLLLTPAMGVPSEYMLQDTLKSMLVSFFVIGLALWFVYRSKSSTEWRFHGVLGFPVLVGLCALGSMLWATNAYLAGVEAVRWFVFGVLLWLGLQVLRREKFDEIAAWIHAGAVAAAIWGLLQFWLNLKLFPQGFAPASTFVNRNFAAEFIVAVFPVSIYVLLRARSPAMVAVLSYSLALNLVFVLACATRSALVGLLLSLIPVIGGLWLFREKLAWPHWDKNTRIASVGVFLFATITLGMIPSPIDTEEFYKVNAFARSFGRAQTFANIQQDQSVGMRKTMWMTTVKMIADRPVSGVGGGNWEVEQPIYQKDGKQLEIDYYAHNEFLQHVAEYGLVGWITVIGLNVLLALAAWRTWQRRNEESMREEALLRVTALSSLFALFVVSCAGFPWRMATTGALFAIGLAAVGASDLRLGWCGGVKRWLGSVSKQTALWPTRFALSVALLLAVWISWQAALCEYLIVRAAKLSLGVSYASNPQDPQWDETKKIIVDNIRRGISINSHYRKLTAMPADEMASWGDWPHAVEIWESLLKSRPYVVVMMVNAARGYAAMELFDKSQSWIDRIRSYQPKSAGARSVEVYMLDKQGKIDEAVRVARLALDEKTVDPDLAHNAYRLGIKTDDPKLSLDALAARTLLHPWEAPVNHVKSGEVYDKLGRRDLALAEYRKAKQATKPEMYEELYKRVPADYVTKLRDSN
jgi:O-antigen ligase